MAEAIASLATLQPLLAMEHLSDARGLWRFARLRDAEQRWFERFHTRVGEPP